MPFTLFSTNTIPSNGLERSFCKVVVVLLGHRIAGKIVIFVAAKNNFLGRQGLPNLQETSAFTHDRSIRVAPRPVTGVVAAKATPPQMFPMGMATAAVPSASGSSGELLARVTLLVVFTW